MKRHRGPIGSLLKRAEGVLRGLKQRFRVWRQRQRLFRAARRIDRQAVVAAAGRLPAVEVVILVPDDSPETARDHARCLESLRRQALPAAGVTSIREKPLEGLREVLAGPGGAPVAVCLAATEFCDDATLWIGHALAGAGPFKALYADYVAAGQPCLEPDFSWLHLLARNFVGPFVVYDRATAAAAVDRLRAAEPPLAMAEVPYALALEALAGLDARSVLHVRQPLAMQSSATPPALHGTAAAALARRGVLARVAPHPRDPAIHRFEFIRRESPRVTVIIPTKNAAALVEQCIASARATAGYDAYKIVVIDHESDEPRLRAYLEGESAAGRLEVMPWSGPFNFAAMNNAAVRRTTSPLVLFLNNDIDGFSSGWLDQLVATLELDPAIAAAGCLLAYPDGDVQHAGVMFTPRRHGFHGQAGVPVGSLGYRGRIESLQEYSAVTAAMMLVKREAFEQVGGFDEVFPDDYNDVDLCLRLRAAGRRIAYTPHVRAVHWESRTRTQQWTAREVFEARWAGVFAADPFYHPYFSERAFGPDPLAACWRERKAVALSDAIMTGSPGQSRPSA